MKSFHLDRETSNHLDQIIWIKLSGSIYLDQIIWIKLSESNYLNQIIWIKLSGSIFISIFVSISTSIFTSIFISIFQSKFFKGNLKFIYLVHIHNFQLLAKSSKFFNFGSMNPWIPNFHTLWIPRNFSRSKTKQTMRPSKLWRM